MIDQRLIDYIKEQKNKGVSKEEIVSVLIKTGWKAEDIEENYLQTETFAPPVPVQSNIEGKLPGPFALLKLSWKKLVERFFSLLWIQSLPTLLVLIFMLIAVIILAVSGVAAGITQNYSDPTQIFTSGGIILLVLFFIFMVVFMIVGVWSQLALLQAIVSPEKIKFKEAYGMTKNKIFRYFWLSLVLGITASGAYLLLLIPGIIFSIWFSFSIYILISENLGGMNAMLKSREYVRNYWWQVLGRMLFVSFFLYLIVFLISYLFERLDLSIFGSIFSFLTSMIIPQLILIYMVELFLSLKAIKGDIQMDFSAKKKMPYILIALFGIIFITVFTFYWSANILKLIDRYPFPTPLIEKNIPQEVIDSSTPLET